MIRLGVVGCGQWGMNHLRVFSSLPGVTLAVGCDHDPERLKRVQRLYPHVAVTTNLTELWKDASLQAVVVATPSATHYAIAKSALESGKDVLCEKPLTTSLAHAEELVRLAQRHQRILMVGHVFVFNPAVQKLYEYVKQGTLGTLYYLSARRTNLGPIRSDVDVIWDLASHDLSMFDYLLDGTAPRSLSASGGAFLASARADVAFISLEYPNHVVANVQVSWLDPQKRRELTVVGSEKMAIFNDVSLDAPLWVYDKGASLVQDYETYEQFRIQSWDRDATVPHFSRVEPLLNEAMHFVECVEHRQTPRTDGQNGLRIVRILEAIARSMGQGGAPVPLT